MTDDYLGPEPTRDETADRMFVNYDRVFAALKVTALQVKEERDRYMVVLRKIAGWQSYRPGEIPLTDYERGANDMLATLAGFADEALS